MEPVILTLGIASVIWAILLWITRIFFLGKTVSPGTYQQLKMRTSKIHDTKKTSITQEEVDTDQLAKELINQVKI